MLIATALVASAAFATFPLWHAAQKTVAGAGRVTAPAGGSLTAFQRDAEAFLRYSLRLTHRCTGDCRGSLPEIAEARQFGHLATAGVASLPAGFRLPVTAPSPASIGSLVADSFALLARSPAPHIIATSPAAVPVPVRVEPSVVVPLPRETFAVAAVPVPAARLDRPAGKTDAPAAPLTPVGDIASTSSDRLPLATPGMVFGPDDGVAIYDISAKTVYLPNGQRLEAHSGLGYMVDNPRYVDRRNTGPTPPNTYNLEMRKGRFHGVEALRLIPADGNNKYGRVGLLAHTYLLRGRPAESNGCVAFKDYARFLAAFKRGTVKRLVVVPSLSGSSMRMASR